MGQAGRTTHHGIGVSKQIGLALVGSRQLLLHAHRCLMSLVLLFKPGDIPNSNSEIHRSRNDQVFGGVELGRPVKNFSDQS
jgi:hypothetical protein